MLGLKFKEVSIHHRINDPNLNLDSWKSQRIISLKLTIFIQCNIYLHASLFISYTLTVNFGVKH